jgi:hypothetical protein
MDPATATVVGATITAVGSLIQTGLSAKAQVTQLSSTAANDGNSMKSEYGTGVSTLITISNGTGADLVLTDSGSADYSGHVWKYPVPTSIGPGQIGVFLHVKTSGVARGSVGALVYRFTGPNGQTYDAYFGWENPYSGDNSVYVEARESGHWGNPGGRGTQQATLDWMYDNCLEKASSRTSQSSWDGVQAVASIGQDSSPFCNFEVLYL